MIDADANTADSDADTLTFTIAVTYGCAGSTAVGGSSVTSGGIVDDCEALLASEATLVGAGTALNWDTGTAMSSWDGVLVEGNRVSELFLSSRSLMGSIPSELGNLSSLITLDLANNLLSGSIPSELGNLSSLTDVWLSDNDLTGSIPSELGNLSSLIRLLLSGNSLSGSIPSELGNLSSLTQLKLINNSLTGCIPAGLPAASSSFRYNPQKNSVTLPVCPGVPTLSLTPGDARIDASWTQPAGATPTGYDLEYRLSTDTDWTDAGHSDSTRTATIGSLTNGSEYAVRVRATISAGSGLWSSTASATPADAAPAFSSASVNGDKLTITFNEDLAAAANLANSAFTVIG